jgi:SAM-dependent methyltransferase
MRNRLFTTEDEPATGYQGLAVHARDGVHEQAMALLRRRVPPPARVLDVGAGAGAFSRRLHDVGYAVAALDRDPSRWAAPEVPFVEVDLNAGFAGAVTGPFAAACCLEVIEHVENPWSLLREIAAVVAPGGTLLLSTPNVGSFLSRAMFLRWGTFHQFGAGDLEYGHIRPVTAAEVAALAPRTGWNQLETHPAGYLPVFDLATRHPKSLAFNLLRGLAHVVGSGHKRGWCLLFVMERSAG